MLSKFECAAFTLSAKAVRMRQIEGAFRKVRFADAQSDYFSVFTAQVFRLGVWGNRPILAEYNLRENGWEEPQSNIAPFISLKNCASSGFYPRTLFANFREPLKNKFCELKFFTARLRTAFLKKRPLFAAFLRLMGRG